MSPGVNHGQIEHNDLVRAVFDHPAHNVALKSTRTQPLTYGQLEREVNVLSELIKGVLPENYRNDKVCTVLHLPNSVAYVEALLSLGVLDCPFVSVAVGRTATPLTRLQYILKDVGASVMISTRAVVDSGDLAQLNPRQLASTEGAGLTVEEELVILQVGTVGSTPAVDLDEDCCYVMYTSGSTGNPKGVQCGKTAVVNMARGQINRFRLSANDVTAQFSPVGFDAVISEVFSTLLSGGTLAVLYDTERLGIELCAALEELGVTVITLPPSLLVQYKRNEFKTLRKLISAGEACPKRIGDLWVQDGDLQFFNAYGTAETTVCCLVYEHSAEHVGEGKQAGGESLPIGNVLPNVTVSVKDHALNDVGVNVVGEICVGGEGLALGYIGQASELTNDRFVPDPNKPGQKIYCTGDLGVRLESGDLVFKGRVDEQRKLRGQMVNLRGIEEAILQVKGVSQAVAVIHQVGAGSESIAAFVSPKSVSEQHIREVLHQRLECHENPAHIKMVDAEELPRNPSGKIDKKVLAQDESLLLGAAAQHQDGDGDAMTEMERRVAEVYCTILETDHELIEQMSRESSLADVGINSDKIGKVQKEFKKVFGVKIPSPQIEIIASLQKMAEVVQNAMDNQQ